MACLLSVFSLCLFFKCPPFLPKLAIDSLFLYPLLKFKKKRMCLGQENHHYSFCAMLFGLRYLIGHFSIHRLANVADQGVGLINPCFNQLGQRYQQPVHSRATYKKVSKVYSLNGCSGLRSFFKRGLWIYISKTIMLSAMSFGGKVDLCLDYNST